MRANGPAKSVRREWWEVRSLWSALTPHPGPVASQARHESVAPQESFASRNVVAKRGRELWSSLRGEGNGGALTGLNAFAGGWLLRLVLRTQPRSVRRVAWRGRGSMA